MLPCYKYTTRAMNSKITYSNYEGPSIAHSDLKRRCCPSTPMSMLPQPQMSAVCRVIQGLHNHKRGLRYMFCVTTSRNPIGNSITNYSLHITECMALQFSCAGRLDHESKNWIPTTLNPNSPLGFIGFRNPENPMGLGPKCYTLAPNPKPLSPEPYIRFSHLFGWGFFLGICFYVFFCGIFLWFSVRQT